ncbi:IS630 family transposase [Terriglobus albidus]|uniref:IS630 family transposase n=1 Tax=Terriglobus albidus TaxID=1592106 RepID=UPI0021DF7689|nr:IS630 family transposase [Terriglobus albidus]
MGKTGLACSQKKASRLKAWLVFLDESGFLLAPLVRRSWAPCGQTPVLYQRGRHHKKVSAIAALCVSPERDEVRLYFRLYPGGDVDSTRVINFLRALNHELEVNWCLIWDRLNAHRSKQTSQWLAGAERLWTSFFPPYAPELNPVEYLWSWAKMNPLANRAFFDIDDLAVEARHAARSLQHKQTLLRSFVQHSPLLLRLK